LFGGTAEERCGDPRLRAKLHLIALKIEEALPVLRFFNFVIDFLQHFFDMRGPFQAHYIL